MRKIKETKMNRRLRRWWQFRTGENYRPADATDRREKRRWRRSWQQYGQSGRTVLLVDSTFDLTIVHVGQHDSNLFVGRTVADHQARTGCGEEHYLVRTFSSMTELRRHVTRHEFPSPMRWSSFTVVRLRR